MTAPFYFLPRLSQADLVVGNLLSRAPLVAAGLDDVLADVRSKDQAVVMDFPKTGPAGSGVLLYAIPNHQRLPGHLGYYPDKQTWHRVNDRLWIGFDNESPPTPEDLERRKILRGYQLPLPTSDLRPPTSDVSLHVPILRSPSGATSLPEDFTFDEAGELQRSIKSEYVPLWEESADVWDLVIDRKPGASMDLVRGIKFCCRLLGLNYRFSTREQSFLKWVDSENWTDLLCLCVDLPAVKEYAEGTGGRGQAAGEDGSPSAEQKKTDCRAPGSVRRSPGSPDSDPSTAPAAATSGSPPSSASAISP